jgi:hypothetical protein
LLCFFGSAKNRCDLGDGDLDGPLITFLSYKLPAIVRQPPVICFGGSRITAGLIFLRCGGPTRRQERSGGKPRQKKRALRLRRTLHLSSLAPTTNLVFGSLQLRR